MPCQNAKATKNARVDKLGYILAISITPNKREA
jgi:hypothetical protein